MDLELPGIDGIEAMRAIMADAPCPIVVLSGTLRSTQHDRTFESFEAGAVEVLAKPEGLTEARVAAFRDRLLKTLRLMSTARVVRRRSIRSPIGRAANNDTLPDHEIVAIGGSTGAPAVLQEILKTIDAPYPLPVVVAQHLVPGFETALARWLAGTRHHVEVASDRLPLVPGRILLAPADRDLVVERGLVRVIEPATGVMTPSVDHLFLSVREAYGATAIAVLLTGMGEDGARGLLALERAGAVTIAQSAESSVVDGMPAAARALGAVQHDLAPAGIADVLRTAGWSRPVTVRP
jgi:two-component system chemotaxis response regulator CheB